MDHLKVIAIKFLAIFFTILAIFTIFNQVTIDEILLLSVLTTIISYVVGDLLFLRLFGNIIASFLDFGLAFFTIWGLSLFIVGTNIPAITLALLSAFFISCCEPFVHGYMVNKIPMKRMDHYSMNQLQTEFSEEADVHDLDEYKRD